MILNQRVRADDNIHRMCGERRIDLRTFLLRQPPREKSHTNAKRREQRLQIIIMLTRQDLRRRHQRTLISVLRCFDESEQGDCGLSRANISLHEAAHGQRRLHIARDLPPYLRLILGQFEGQRLQNARSQHTVWPVCNPFLLLRRPLFEGEQPTLDEIEFLKGKPPTRRAQFLLPLWEVNPSKGIRTSDEIILLPNARRKGLRKLICALRESILHHLPQLFLRESLGCRIDGQNAEQRFRMIARAEQLKGCDLRKRKLSAAVIGIVRLPREENAPALTQLRLQKALIKPDCLHVARPVADERSQHGEPAPPRLAVRPCLQIGNARNAALILICARIISQEVIYRSNAEPRKGGRLLYANAANFADAVRELHSLPSFPLFKKEAAANIAAASSTEQ